MVNPFRPGAGQKPPHLAGREKEKEAFSKLLDQDVVIKNLILTGLRGTGKTVLSETFKPIATGKKWTWIGSDLSESASASEETIAIRLLTDLAVITSQIVVGKKNVPGFNLDDEGDNITLNYENLVGIFRSMPGLVSDKLKSTLEFIWANASEKLKTKGIVFAYDEAQNMNDSEKEKQYPLSVLLDVFQSIQRKEIPFLLVLIGLPTLFPKLVSTRTFSERMFTIIELNSLSHDESLEAIVKPTQSPDCPVQFSTASVNTIVEKSGGYPYFIQFICRETYDSFLSQLQSGITNPSVPITEIVAKLDTEFFSGRWNILSDRQRELLFTVAKLEEPESEFSIQEVVEKSKVTLEKSIGNSQINQMFVKLTEMGLVYRTRHGKYRLGIPLLSGYIKRQTI